MPVVGIAESYENQRFMPLKGWGNSLLPTDRAKFSDKDGKRSQPLEGMVLSSLFFFRHPGILLFFFLSYYFHSMCSVSSNLSSLPRSHESYVDVALPEGWAWRGPWYLAPERLDVDEEAALHAVVEESFENQRYYPLRGWSTKVYCVGH